MKLRPEQQRLLDTLALKWQSYPELRLGQLLDGARYEGESAPVDMFYITDAELRRMLERYKP